MRTQDGWKDGTVPEARSQPGIKQARSPWGHQLGSGGHPAIVGNALGGCQIGWEPQPGFLANIILVCKIFSPSSPNLGDFGGRWIFLFFFLF